MRIQHNISALNSHRNLGINNSFTSKNLEKLSSGYRINRAGDDAAGLAISEKMRGQIRGLAMAEQNTANGISLIQTAEGGLNETHAILQRMRELAVQSSNGTYQDEDRIQITKEYENLKDEIDRISQSTHYNNIKLLDGSLGGKSSATASNVNADTIINMSASGGATLDLSAVFATDPGTAEAHTTSAAGGTLLGATTGLWTANATDAAVRDVTVEYVDEAGETKSVTVRIDNINSSTGAVTAWNAGTAATDALISALQKTDLAKHFEITASTNEIAFTSMKTGQEGAAHISNIKMEKLVDSATVLAGTAAEKKDALNALADAQKGKVATTLVGGAKTGGLNATLTVDISTHTLGDKNENWFEVGGHKFVLTNEFDTGTKTNDGATYLRVADVTTMTAGEQAQAARVMEEALGLKVSSTATEFVIEAASSDLQGAGMTKGTALVFQIGANGGADQRVSLSVNAMDTRNLGITSEAVAYTKVTGVTLRDSSISDIDSSNKAIDIISGASNMVSTQRAELGAMQNRLEHTMNNLGVTKENLTAAESTIRDVDMAKEMMEFTKNQILVQASQAMLAQANQLPQGVLSLLR